MKKKLIGYCVEQKHYFKFKSGWSISGWEPHWNYKIYRDKKVAQEAIDNYVSTAKQYRIKPIYQLSGDEEEFVPIMKYALRGKFLDKKDNPWFTFNLHNSYEEANNKLQEYLNRTDIEFEIEEIKL